ncbi:MAG: lytic transglycosylase domain-containing protein [Oscillospiraceae bacterium]|nr:lytic transglycosylase domain-containing protein [Oscillospiraceae bacterium]MCL2279967.1 lytic transglycosylase domain-containing protein [Oscillospiraceae bacterium]
MTLGVIKPEPQPVQPTYQPQPNQQVSGTQFNQFFNPTNFGGTFRTNSLTSGCDELDSIFEAAGRRYNLSPDLLKAVAKVESNFRTDATSRAGAMGIMQLMPGTARYLGVDDPFDPQQSIFGGARYLREQLDRFNGDIELALAAYNAGWPTVKQHGGIPPFRETQAYVQKVLGHLADSEIAPSLLAITFDNSRASHNASNTDNNNNNTNSAPAPPGSGGASSPTAPPGSSGPSGSPGPSGPSSNPGPSFGPGSSGPSGSNNNGPPQFTFNIDEALAQMLFNKLMNMKAEAANSNSNSSSDNSSSSDSEEESYETYYGSNYESNYEGNYEESQEENYYKYV